VTTTTLTFQHQFILRHLVIQFLIRGTTYYICTQDSHFNSLVLGSLTLPHVTNNHCGFSPVATIGVGMTLLGI